GMRRRMDLERATLRLRLDGARSARGGRADHARIERRGSRLVWDLPDLTRLGDKRDPVRAWLERGEPLRRGAGRRSLEQCGLDDDVQAAGQHRRGIAAGLRL